MADEKQVEILKRGDGKAWNEWREEESLKAGARGFLIDLRGADLSGVDLKNTQLNLTYADLSSAVLRGALLNGGQFIDAKLDGADLEDTNLAGSILVRAKFRNAVCRNAKLRYAILDEADLTNCDLSGAKLRNAKGMTQAQLNSARWDPDSPPELPEGLRLPDPPRDPGPEDDEDFDTGPQIPETVREALRVKTSELIGELNLKWRDAGLTQSQFNQAAEHLEAVHHLLLAPKPEVHVVLRALETPAKILKKAPALITYILGVLTEINILIEQLEKTGVDVTEVKELIKRLFDYLL